MVWEHVPEAYVDFFYRSYPLLVQGTNMLYSVPKAHFLKYAIQLVEMGRCFQSNCFFSSNQNSSLLRVRSHFSCNLDLIWNACVVFRGEPWAVWMCSGLTGVCAAAGGRSPTGRPVQNQRRDSHLGIFDSTVKSDEEEVARSL